MEQYIDKFALVAEIERRMTPECGYTLNKLLDYIDTLEVKEVQEEPVSEDLEEAIGQSFIYHENHGDDFRSDKQIETAYRYGFESGAEWQKAKDEYITEDLGEYISELAKQFPEVSFAKLSRIAVMVAKWQKEKDQKK